MTKRKFNVSPNRNVKHIPYGSRKKSCDFIYIRGEGEFEINTINKDKARKDGKQEIKTQLEEFN